MKKKQPTSLNEEPVNRGFGVRAHRIDLPPDGGEYVRVMQELRGKFRGKGLMKALMIEKNRQK